MAKRHDQDELLANAQMIFARELTPEQIAAAAWLRDLDDAEFREMVTRMLTGPESDVRHVLRSPAVVARHAEVTRRIMTDAAVQIAETSDPAARRRLSHLREHAAAELRMATAVLKIIAAAELGELNSRRRAERIVARGHLDEVRFVQAMLQQGAVNDAAALALADRRREGAPAGKRAYADWLLGQLLHDITREITAALDQGGTPEQAKSRAGDLLRTRYGS